MQKTVFHKECTQEISPRSVTFTKVPKGTWFHKSKLDIAL